MNISLRHTLTVCLLACGLCAFSQSPRSETLITNWRFSRTDAPAQSQTNFNDSKWQKVTVPHDWAVYGPFDKEIDKQTVAIVQNGEKEATEKTGRSGSLPWIGVGWYRAQFSVPADCGSAWLNFDGAMAEPQVYVNGQLAGEWKYGYSAFNVDITPYVNKDGRPNTVAVRLQNLEESSRWYPGAGLYRPVTLVTTHQRHIMPWGIDVQTMDCNTFTNTAKLQVSVNVSAWKEGDIVRFTIDGKNFDLNFPKINGLPQHTNAKAVVELDNARLWSIAKPYCYDAKVSIIDAGGNTLDAKTFKYGIRKISYGEAIQDITGKNGLGGFCINGIPVKFKGVCLHHDLGMLGSAVNKAALTRQLQLLKSMGCNAIRTAHNMPSQWQMDLCDSLGILVMAESFDMWKYAKCKNGYARFYDEWWRRDLQNLVRANQLHPSIVMWSIGNEIPEQGMKEGNRMTREMQDWMHQLDPTRPVTAGMDRIDNALSTGYAQILDIPGMNYRTHKYDMAYEKLRHGFLLGSETASTVSSRGVYKFPVAYSKGAKYDDGQCSGYDVQACSWSNVPEEDWVMQDDRPWMMGEFVWTGFDYLGEPTPYDEYWPSRSSYFGIFDLAGLPKDRYWLYRARWNNHQHTIHLLPHWNWKGREGEVTPVYCYTDYPSAELFVNGKSQGRISKNTTLTGADGPAFDRYRLRWNEVKYEPGELKVVVYDKDGRVAGEQVVKTVGEPDHIELIADHGVAGGLASYADMKPTDDPTLVSLSEPIKADGEDIVFITAVAVDKDGNICPDADNQLQVKVGGNARFRGICNGDATSLEVFTQPTMRLFHGRLVIGVQTTDKAGNINVKVTGKGLKSASLNLQSK